jgi:hypothetical protein
MKVSVKDLGVEMQVKNRGIELEVRDAQGTQVGDLVITKSRLIWCPGRTRPENGIPISWRRFIAMMSARRRV